MGIVIAVIILIILLICSALISSSEVAFFSLTDNDIKDIEAEQAASSQKIIQLRNKPRTLLATILIANNFINIAIVVISDFILKKILQGPVLDGWSTSLIDLFGLNDSNFFTIARTSNLINFSITVIGVTFLLVLFGEVAPKIYAKLNNLKLSHFMAGPLTTLLRLFSPFSKLLVGGTNLIEKRLSQRSINSTIASIEEIGHAIELTVKDEKHGKRDIDILKGIVKFGDVSVKQIMRSRLDVIAVDFRTTFTDLLKVIKDSGYSRIPVYDEDFDNVTGMLYTKDLIAHLDSEPGFEWQPLIRPKVYYVPEAKKINELMREFQQIRSHMAIVVDEYGGTSGIVTLEDVMEEIIGDIKDEFDDEIEIDYVKVDEHNFVFEGKTLLNDLCRVIEVETDTFDQARGDADSLAGLFLELYGAIPKGEAQVEYNGYKLKIVSFDKKRIIKVKLTKPQD